MRLHAMPPTKPSLGFSLIWLALAATLAGTLAFSQSAPPQPAAARLFSEVQPVFAQSCFGCHGAKVQLGGLRLDEKSAAFAGGNLYVVRAKSKTLLLSVATTGVTCLADLTEVPVEPTHEVLSFQEMVDEAPGVAPVAVVHYDEPDQRDIRAALDRLRRLSE